MYQDQTRAAILWDALEGIDGPIDDREEVAAIAQLMRECQTEERLREIGRRVAKTTLSDVDVLALRWVYSRVKLRLAVKLRLLDLFCGAGGAAVGYHRSGFDVVGVDNVPQPRYPFAFHLCDAIEFCVEHGGEYDVIHASPPCQSYSAKTAHMARERPKCIGALRDAMARLAVPWVIENVVGAPLHFPLMLCGAMFGLRTYRHRLFETSHLLLGRPAHPKHVIRGSRAGHWVPGEYISVAGNAAPIAVSRQAMGIGWMTRRELTQAIPPAYTEWLGCRLRNLISRM